VLFEHERRIMAALLRSCCFARWRVPFYLFLFKFFLIGLGVEEVSGDVDLIRRRDCEVRFRVQLLRFLEDEYIVVFECRI
jgi:hypothetical protein